MAGAECLLRQLAAQLGELGSVLLEQLVGIALEVLNIRRARVGPDRLATELGEREPPSRSSRAREMTFSLGTINTIEICKAAVGGRTRRLIASNPGSGVLREYDSGDPASSSADISLCAL